MMLQIVMKTGRMTVEQSLASTVTVDCVLLLRLLRQVMMRMMTVDVVTGVLLLPLGAPVLEPDLHLRLGETERQGQTQALADGQVASQAELAFERSQLVVAERRPSPATARPSAGVIAARAAARIRHHISVVTSDHFIATSAIYCV